MAIEILGTKSELDIAREEYLETVDQTYAVLDKLLSTHGHPLTVYHDRISEDGMAMRLPITSPGAFFEHIDVGLDLNIEHNRILIVREEYDPDFDDIRVLVNRLKRGSKEFDNAQDFSVSSTSVIYGRFDPEMPNIILGRESVAIEEDQFSKQDYLPEFEELSVEGLAYGIQIGGYLMQLSASLNPVDQKQFERPTW